jgi:hypothetical protein
MPQAPEAHTCGHQVKPIGSLNSPTKPQPYHLHTVAYRMQLTSITQIALYYAGSTYAVRLQQC